MPDRRATTTSARLPASSGPTACDKARDDQETDAGRDAGVGGVEDVLPEEVRPQSVAIDEVDDEPEVEAIGDVADRAADDHAEGDPHEERLVRAILERYPEDGEHDQRHDDEQERVVAEEAERAVRVLLVRPLEPTVDHHPALAGHQMLDDPRLRPLIEGDD